MNAVEPVTLFCLPYAGAGAAIYRDWQGQLADWVRPVPLHLPGRGARHAQPALHDWPSLMDILLDDVRPHIDRPFAIFGHSLGGIAGFELAHAIRQRCGRSPVWLGISASIAPLHRERELKWLDCPDAEMIEELRTLKGTPEEVLQSAELLELVLPVLRADFHLSGSYRPGSRVPLACPILVMGGKEDARVSAPIENLTGWDRETSGPCELMMFEGDHFFLAQQSAAVTAAISQALAVALPMREAARVG